jgi:hypothetical protein
MDESVLVPLKPTGKSLRTYDYYSLSCHLFLMHCHFVGFHVSPAIIFNLFYVGEEPNHTTAIKPSLLEIIAILSGRHCPPLLKCR